MLDYALAYARQGLHVFPIVPDGKTPLTSHGFHDATTDEAQIDAWWSQSPDANIGIATGKVSGLVVVDVDRHGEDGTKALQTLNLPPTRVVRTPRNGYHFIFRYPDGAEIGRVIGVLPGIDLLGDNGYVVACGSRVGGKLYELLRNREPAPCPPQLIELAAKRRKTNGAAALTGSGKVSEGKRNDYLASIAGILRRDGFDAEAIEAALQIENTKKCEQPLPPDEVATIARSIARYEPAQILEPEAAIATGQRESRLEQLATLSRVEYDRQRAEAAKELGIRASTLDAEVESRRDDVTDEQNVTLADPEPWPDEVDGAALLGRMREEFSRYVVLPAHGATAAALWALHTWCAEAFFISPCLFPKSPQKRCGKSTLMMVLRELVRRPLMATSASAAAVFRCIEKFQPTLLLDEADTWLRENEELRGILNGGHSRRTAWVLRTVGDEHEPHAFPTYCPKAISGIGRLIDTLEDRSIIIPMVRKRREDKVARLREDALDLATLRRQCFRWASDRAAELKNADPETPGALNDRAADNWRCLLAIADLAGGSWPAEARSAALALSADQEDEAVGTQLLADIRTVFERLNDPLRPISSTVLVETLGGMEDRPWTDWKNGKAMTAPQMARLLKPFDIRPRTVRISTGTAKGYHPEQFDDAFSRYLSGASQAVTPSQPYENRQNDAILAVTPLSVTPVTPSQADAECYGVTATSKNGVTAELDAEAYENRHCDGVTDRSDPETAREGRYSELIV